MTASREMPKYQCHKQVWALKIKTVAVHASGDTAVSDAEFQVGVGDARRKFRNHVHAVAADVRVIDSVRANPMTANLKGRGGVVERAPAQHVGEVLIERAGVE